MTCKDRDKQQSFTGLRLCSLAAAFLVICYPTPLRAQSADFDVNASIVKGCWFTGVGSNGNLGPVRSLNFGAISATEATTITKPITVTQAFTLRCSPDTPLTVAMGNGQHADDTDRRMRLGSTSHYLPYSLCTDASCSQSLDLGHSDSSSFDTATSLVLTLTYYGSVTVPAGSPVGVYTDEVTVTYSW